MNKLKLFANLTRINRPIGFMLLFWPCSWGLTIGFVNNSNVHEYLVYLILFFLGSVLMRSAGCIFNDIVDKDLDIKVTRTKTRPIASGKISVYQAFSYVVILCLLALIILLQFNKLTILLGLGSMVLAFSYPFMKRITYWPQLFLGLTFNWGIIMAWASLTNEVSLEPILLYIGAIFWTLGYDTIYGAQDMIDDEIIGIKSTAIKFKTDIKLFVFISYFVTFLCFMILFYNKLGLNIFTLLFISFFISLFFQVKIFNKKKPLECLKAFKMNNFSGFLLFLALLSQTNMFKFL
tara:strand:+ start:197 stop:1072 length:876 start_codon:yes stop_codon:yes gene_type:complete